MVRITVNVSNSELDALEDKAIAWNLCDKHNAVMNASEDDRWRFTQKCKKCIKINRELSSNVLHFWSKLVTAYENARKRKLRK